MSQSATEPTATVVETSAPSRTRTLAVCGTTHALHDGYTDLLNVLFPLLQAQFGLSYTAIGTLRTIYSTAMAGGQIPSGMLSERFGGRRILALGTMAAAAGYAIAGWSGGLVGAAIGIGLSGLGSSTQHPIASSLVSAAYPGAASRPALGTYNFAGDVGKMALPIGFALIASLWHWQAALLAMSLLGLILALAIPALLPPSLDAALTKPVAQDDTKAPAPRGAFRVLQAVGFIDSLVRAGYLTFLPFILTAKGASLPMLGVALSLLFAGGAAGKLVCGWLGQRLGVLPVVAITEGMTAMAMLATLWLPLEATLALLPLLGLALNGTSSVLYGSIPELVPPDRRTRAFSIFYTGGSIAGAVGPLAGGAMGDIFGLNTMVIALSVMAAITIPLAMPLRRHVR